MRLRIADDADLDTVVALRLAFMGEVRRRPDLGEHAALAEATRGFVATQHDAGTMRTWLAETADGTAVGITSVLLHAIPPLPEDLRPHSGYVINVWVAPDHRRRGIARALLDRCIAEVDELGIRRLFLFATTQGRPLYEAAGFAPDPIELQLPIPRTR